VTEQAPPNLVASEPVGRSVWLVVALGLVYSTLGAALGDRTDSSVLWWLDPLLLWGFAIGLWLRGRGILPLWKRPGRRAAAAVFVVGSWAAGMLVELSLRAGESGFGGLHPDTRTSFLLAQAFYPAYALGGWWLVRRFRLSLRGLFWVGAGAALYEGITVGAAAVAGGGVPWPFVPLLAAYYALVYAAMLCWPLLLVPEAALWREAESPAFTGWLRPLLAGIGLSVVSYGLMVAWGSVLGV
jgi:hypothetical protein